MPDLLESVLWYFSKRAQQCVVPSSALHASQAQIGKLFQSRFKPILCNFSGKTMPEPAGLDRVPDFASASATFQTPAPRSAEYVPD